MSSISKLPSEQRFGLTFAALFFAVAMYWVFQGAGRTYIALFAASFTIALIALVAPRILALPNRAWFQLGQLLGRIVSPAVMSLIFFGLLTPIALVTRMLGRDELHLKRRAVASYWINRSPPGPTRESFKNQF
jgi:hypothetical protein